MRLVAADGEVKTFDDMRATVTGSSWTAWQQAKFGANAGNPAMADDTADSDFDGVDNLLEYAMNTDPLVASAQPVIGMEPGFLTITYRRNLVANDVTYTIMEATTPSAWSVATVTEQILSDDGTTRVIKANVPVNRAPQKFLRLRVAKS